MIGEIYISSFIKYFYGNDSGVRSPTARINLQFIDRIVKEVGDLNFF